jgi:hypothetical protein
MTSTIQEETAVTGVNGAPRTGDQLQGAASGLLDQAARTADAQASTTMTRIGQALDGVARAIDEAAGGMRETQPEIANLVTTAGDRVSGAASYLRDHNASEALTEVQELARRQPALIVGGGLVLGIVLGRFLRTGAAVAQSDMRAVGPGRSGYGTADRYGADRYGYGSIDTADELAATDAAVAETITDADVEGRSEAR